MGLFGFGDKKVRFASIRIIEHSSGIVSAVEKACKDAGATSIEYHAGHLFYAATITTVCWTTFLTPQSGMSEAILKKTFSIYRQKFGDGFFKYLQECHIMVQNTIGAVPQTAENIIQCALGWLEAALEECSLAKWDKVYEGTLESAFSTTIKKELPNIIDHLHNPGDPDQEERQLREFEKRIGLDTNKLFGRR